MKKTILLLSFVILSSCSSTDDNSNNSSSTLHPSSWIQGTWGIKASQGMPEQAVYKFENDNLCQLISVSSLCWKEMANQYKNTGVNFVLEDKETSSTYEAKIGSGGSFITLKFERVSATQIKWVNNGIMDITYDKLN